MLSLQKENLFKPKSQKLFVEWKTKKSRSSFCKSLLSSSRSDNGFQVHK